MCISRRGVAADSPARQGHAIVESGSGERERTAGNRAGTWQAAQGDSMIADSSAIVRKFMELAQSSRYRWLTDIQDSLMAGNVAAAQALMAYPADSFVNTQTDSATGVVIGDSYDAGYVVDNYLAYYNLYIKHMQDTLSADDSAQVEGLANLCPRTDGLVVYEARALYSILHNDNRIFEDSCIDVDTSMARRGHSANSGPAAANPAQGYSLHPNPSDGNINIVQQVADDGVVRAEVYNATGASVYKGILQFTGQHADVHVRNVSAGLYLLKLTDSSGRTFNLKFVIE